MLQKKFNHSRLKEKPKSTFGVKKPFKSKNRNRKGSKNITNQDKAYLKWLQSYNCGCFVCGGFDCIEWHHVKEFSSDKKNHKRLIPLCGIEHHRLGSELSAHGTPKKWRETFSMKKQNDFADNIYSFYKENML